MLAVVLAAAALSITTPGPIAAQPHVDGAAAVLELKGRAPRLAAVELRARCVLGPCITNAVADRRGRWKAVLNVVLPRGQRTVRVRAASGLRLSAKRYRLVYPSYAATPPYSDNRRAPQLAVIGDSLSVGADEALRAGLPGWKVTTAGRVGRPLAVGMEILDRTPATRRGPKALGFSLFSNDDPTHVAELELAVRDSLDPLGPRDCALWATIVRRRVGGVSYRYANQVLEALEGAFADRLIVVPWARAVARHPGWMSRDGVHPTAYGYTRRARMFADAARACRTIWDW